jgi:hypothetical protein
MARDADTATFLWVVYAYSDKLKLWELRGFRRFHKDHMPYRSRERTRRKFHIGKHAPMHLTYLGSMWNDHVEPDYRPPTHVPKQFVGPKLREERIEAARDEDERFIWDAIPIDLQHVDAKRRKKAPTSHVSRHSAAISLPESDFNEDVFLRIMIPALRPLNKNGRYFPLKRGKKK